MRSTRETARRAARCAAAALLGVLVAGCAAHRAASAAAPEPAWSEESFAHKDVPRFTVDLDAHGAPVDTVVGKVTTYRVRQGDTLLDVARWYDLGYNEIVDANPGVDPWVPKAGSDVVVPTAWVLPCCSYRGIVVNLPEMRLYRYRRRREAPGKLEVVTYPVGMGRDDRRTPRGTYRVSGKTVNPQWNIPASILREHIAERGDHRTFIPGGAPDNPLGRYRIELASSRYAIHGTNVPWGVGMLVSHGCLRLYPEDIERLFPEVAVGTRVEFVYQPVKAGTRGGATYVEAHPDIYRYTRSLAADARTALARRGLDHAVDAALLRAAVTTPRGVPVQVAPATAALLRPAHAG
ncbi:MAG: L,D-transpeptidase family protein [Acidobacteriota bacterium]